jgi:RimJ/RimL family protein N-acetyltransferase
LLFAFFTLRLEEVVSFTAGVNLRSVKVMQRLGMMHDPQEDFDHPKLPAGNVVQRHMLYRLSNTSDTVARLKTELGIQVNERERVG